MAELLHSLEVAGPDPDPETAHEPDEELGADLSLADTNPAVLTRMWEVLGEVVRPDHELVRRLPGVVGALGLDGPCRGLAAGGARPLQAVGVAGPRADGPLAAHPAVEH